MNAMAHQDEVCAKIEAFAKRLREHRQAIGLSVDNYAKVIRVQPLGLFEWESARGYPKAYVVERIEEFMAIAPDQKAYHAMRDAELDAIRYAGEGGNPR